MTKLDEILNSPLLVNYFNIIKKKLEEEREKREQFLKQIDENTNAEFINGEIIHHSPANFRHVQASDLLYRILSYYVDKHDLGFVAHEKAMLHFQRNNYEPDIAFWRKEIAKNFKPDQLLFPPPDFIAEIISPSTEKIDRTIKFEDYAFHNVQEYWIIDPEKLTVEQYLNKDQKFYLTKKFSANEFITALVIDGFKIPVRAIFDKNENIRYMKIL